MSTLGTLTLSSSALTIPEHGTARCDAVLEAGAVPTVGPAILTIAGYAMNGTLTFADIDAPDLPHAIWQNGAAWDLPLPNTLPPRGYQSDMGVKLSTVLGDLLSDVNVTAKATGYPVESFAALPTDALIEKQYLRPIGTTGRQVLGTLKRMGLVSDWWIDANGATHFDPRPTGASSGRADIMRRNAGVGLRVFGLDTPAGFLPGTTIEGATTRRLVVRERAKSLTADAWSKAIPSLRDAVAAISRRDQPEARYAYPRTYVVRAVGSDGRLDLSPPPDSAGADLSALAKVEQWTMGGALSFPAAGASVLVMFRDARESRACVVGIAPATVGHPSITSADTAGRYALDQGIPGTDLPALYYQAPGATVLTPVALLTPGSTTSGTVPTLPGSTPATTIALGPGSAKIKVAT